MLGAGGTRSPPWPDISPVPNLYRIDDTCCISTPTAALPLPPNEHAAADVCGFCGHDVGPQIVERGSGLDDAERAEIAERLRRTVDP
jgi:hypothetical protein